jgi:hypothetical protein
MAKETGGTLTAASNLARRLVKAIVTSERVCCCAMSALRGRSPRAGSVSEKDEVIPVAACSYEPRLSERRVASHRGVRAHSCGGQVTHCSVQYTEGCRAPFLLAWEIDRRVRRDGLDRPKNRGNGRLRSTRLIRLVFGATLSVFFGRFKQV